MDDMIEIRDLKYKDLLKYPTINIPHLKATFIEGPSGSGKSTLFKLINGTLPFHSGDILYKKNSIQQIDVQSLRKDILLVGQSVFLFPGSIKDNFHKFYHYKDLPLPLDDEIHKFLSLCHANFDINQLCETLSGGERQRVYTAIFLSFSPEVLLLDEPTSALDHVTGHQVIENILHHCKDKKITPVIISHEKSLIQAYAENIIEISK